MKANYQILDTDYTNYSIVYSCELGIEFLWILTREPVIDNYPFLVQKTEQLLPGFDISRLIK